MQIVWIILGIITILCIGPVCMLLEKCKHWMMRRLGVTELTSKQRRRQAQRYPESTGRHLKQLKKLK